MDISSFLTSCNDVLMNNHKDTKEYCKSEISKINLSKIVLINSEIH